jgi:hypothetical protein
MTTVKELKRKTIIPDRQNMGYITQSMISPCHHGTSSGFGWRNGFQYGE